MLKGRTGFGVAIRAPLSLSRRDWKEAEAQVGNDFDRWSLLEIGQGTESGPTLPGNRSLTRSAPCP